MSTIPPIVQQSYKTSEIAVDPSISLEQLKSLVSVSKPIVLELIDDQNALRELHDACAETLRKKLDQKNLAIKLWLSQELQELQKYSAALWKTKGLGIATKIADVILVIFGLANSQGNSWAMLGSLVPLAKHIPSSTEKNSSTLETITPIILSLLGFGLMLMGRSELPPQELKVWLKRVSNFVMIAINLGTSYYTWEEGKIEQKMVGTQGAVKGEEAVVTALLHQIKLIKSRDINQSNAFSKNIRNVIRTSNATAAVRI